MSEVEDQDLDNFLLEEVEDIVNLDDSTDTTDSEIKEEVKSEPKEEIVDPKPETSETPEVKEVKEVEEPSIEDLYNDSSLDGIPNVAKIGGYPDEYLGIVNSIRIQYSLLPRLDYDALYSELADLSVKTSPTPTLQVLNTEIEKVQACKDRMSEIYIEVLRNHNFKKRATDILQDSWGKFSADKSADKRKGDSLFRTSEFITDFALTESALKACMHVIKNLDSLHDGLSRRITVIQLQMKLHDFGRTDLPDFERRGRRGNQEEELESIMARKKGDPENVEEESF